MAKKPRRRTNVVGQYIYQCVRCGEGILPGQEYRRGKKGKHHHRPNCEHARSVLADELIPIPDDVELSEYPRGGRSFRRYIRSFEAVARQEHSCWLCDMSKSIHRQMESVIYAGDRYAGEVFVSIWGREVRRYHLSCPADPFEEGCGEDIEEEFDDEEVEEDLPLAA